MSSLLEKLRAAKAMQAKIAEVSTETQAALKSTVEEAPAVEELATGPAQVVNNQESPMARLRARMQAKKEGLAEPKESTQAAQSLAQAEAPQAEQQKPKPALAEQVAAERAEARRKLDEQLARYAQKPQAAPEKPQPERKLSLKEKLAAKKAAQAAARQAGEHKLVHRTDGSLRPETKAEQEAREAQSTAPEPESKPMTALERMRARQLAAKKGLDHAPKVSTKAVDESIASFNNTSLPSQPATAAPKARPTIQVEQTGIQGAPQVKEIEAKAGVAANRQAVKLNEKQEKAARLYVDEEQSCVLIGAAGTGKTTGVRGVLQRLKDTGKLEYNADYKRQGGGGLKDRVKDQPNVAICAFTRRASINIMESVTSQPGLEEFKYCCQTVHNLLEYAPEYYEAYDDETGEWVNKMRFCPHRDSANPLDCDWLIIEEASMVDLTLWEKLMDALKPGVRILFLGDINQLPPVFGLPILVYAMYKLPTVELTEVYRQAVGPVLRNAHNVLKGLPLVEEEDGEQAFLCYEEYKTEKGGTNLKRHSIEKGEPIMAGETKMSSIYTAMFKKLFEIGRYDPEQDMIISPFNVGDLGTLHMNQCLAQFIGDAREAVVHEVIAGFHKHYLAEGDKVMVERQDGYIKTIHHNADYMGTLPKQAGHDLSRFGVRILGRNAEDIDLDEAGDVNFDLDAIGEKTAEELKRAASHVITVELESGEEVVLSTSGQFAPEKFTLGYCITGHKSQGSEWRNVYIIMHKKHHSLLTREWLYTTVTRARKQCTLLCKPFSIEKALASQRIAGDTIEDKLAWFTSGAVDNLDEIEVTK